MTDTLDEIVKKNKSKIFSTIAIIVGIITWTYLINLISSVSGTIIASDGIPKPSTFLLRTFLALCIFGVLMAVTSFVKKEPSTWIKWIGAILNVVIFLFIFGSMVLFYFIGTDFI